MFCTKCGNNVPEGSTFCTSCGTPVEAEQTQPKENVVADAAAKVEDAAAKAGAAVAGAATEVVAKAKKLSKKTLIIGAAALVIIILAIIIIAAVSGGGGDTGPLLYRKDDELFAYGMKGDPFMISDDYEVHGSLTLDGDSLFYTDSGENEDGYTHYELYYRDVNNAESKLKDADEEKGVRISKDVSSFIARGEAVVYLTNRSDDGGKLRYNTVKGEEVSIDSDVVSYRFSEDGKKIVYLKQDDDEQVLYQVSVNDLESPKKVASDVESILAVDTETYNTYAFLKANDDGTSNLYLVDKDGEADKILSDVDDWTWGGKDYDDLFLYVAEEIEYTLDDLVEDDLDDDDSEALREESEDDPYLVYAYTIYKLDGSEVVEVLTETSSATIGTEYIIYGPAPSVGEKLDLSDVVDEVGYWWWDIATYALYGEDYGGNSAVFACKLDGGEPYEVLDAESMEEVEMVDFDYDTNTIYLLDEYDYDDDVGVLKAIKLGAKGAEEPVEIYDEVAEFYLVDSNVFYLADMNKSGTEGTAYLWNGKDAEKIADDVWSISGRTANEDDSVIIVWQDYDEGSATLNLWNGKKLETIDEDVYMTEVLYKGDGNLFYLKDYNEGKSRGELYQWNGKEAVSIDDDVTELLR